MAQKHSARHNFVAAEDGKPLETLLEHNAAYCMKPMILKYNTLLTAAASLCKVNYLFGST